MKKSKSTETLSPEEDLFKIIHCFNRGLKDLHVAKNAKKLPCEHHVCSDCVQNSYRNEIYCGHESDNIKCKRKYNINQLHSNEAAVHAIIKKFENELVLKMKEDLEGKISFIKGKFICENLIVLK
jgi:hypothetical protein